jgi:hypothetical protein
VKRLHKVARHDWKHSHPLDLTDEGLMADLEKRGRKGADKLALRVGQAEKQREESLKMREETVLQSGKIFSHWQNEAVKKLVIASSLSFSPPRQGDLRGR